MSHGFEIAPPPAKHFKVAFLPPPLEEKEVEAALEEEGVLICVHSVRKGGFPNETYRLKRA